VGLRGFFHVVGREGVMSLGVVGVFSGLAVVALLEVFRGLLVVLGRLLVVLSCLGVVLSRGM